MNRIVVLGAGESGFGSAVLAKKLGFETFVSDNGAIADKYKTRLLEHAIEFEERGHTLDKILSATEVIKSPGIPDKVEIIKKLKEQGIPIISEIEFAGRYCEGKTICVTGSNGKTTTTTIIYELLKAAGVNAGVGGNIGDSFAYQVATSKRDWYVLELSSFQLDGMYDFKADVSIIANITPDHLDRYDYKMENYIASKFRITNNQTRGDIFIYNDEDPCTKEYMSSHSFTMQRLPFSVKKPMSEGGYLRQDGTISISCLERTIEIETSRLKVQGLHNINNIMASVMAAFAAGASNDAIITALEQFGGVEHRMEAICNNNNILYINDSKATNVDSVWYALQSMNRPTVWIAGGTDKGNDYSALYELAREKVKVLICMGIDNSKLESSFKGIVPTIYSVSSLDQAIEIIWEVSKNGDSVLLSPACASFDLFKNYEQRGELFKNKIWERLK